MQNLPPDDIAELDALLRHMPTPPVPAYLANRILANLPPQDPLQRALDWLLQLWWRPVAATVVPLILGGVIGLSTPADNTADPYVDLASGLSLAESYTYLPEEADDY